MDSDPQNNQKPWQWLISSQTRMVGLVLLILAFVLLLGLMVLVSQKSTKKKAETSTAQASPRLTPSPFPNPTASWETVSKRDFSLKIPPGGKTSYKETVNGASGSAVFRVDLDPQKEATQQAGLAIEVSKGVDISQKEYLKSLTDPKKRLITKPIDILIGGNKGYEFYFEETYDSKAIKIRVIEFSTETKHYVLSAPLDSQSETILSTLNLK